MEVEFCHPCSPARTAPAATDPGGAPQGKGMELGLPPQPRGSCMRCGCCSTCSEKPILHFTSAEKLSVASTSAWTDWQDSRKVELSFIGQEIQIDSLGLLALCLRLQHFHHDLLLLDKESSLDPGKEKHHHEDRCPIKQVAVSFAACSTSWYSTLHKGAVCVPASITTQGQRHQ